MKNTLYPGRENYTGDTFGVFGLLHHDRLYEFSGNVLERVKYVKEEKPENEKPVRLHSMVCLNEFVDEKLLKQAKKAQDEYLKAREKYEKAEEKYEKARDEYLKALEKYKKAWDEFEKTRDEYRKARDKYEKALYELKKSLDYEFVQEKVFELVSDCVWDRKKKEMIFS